MNKFISIGHSSFELCMGRNSLNQQEWGARIHIGWGRAGRHSINFILLFSSIT
jgi:hypothetical protein